MNKKLSELSKLSIAELAGLVADNWQDVYFGARPYLDAMFTLDSIDDNYGADNGRTIVAYFLCNARQWKGETAKLVKAELNKRLKR